MKQGTAQTAVDIMVDGEMMETEVKIYAEYFHDWEFYDDDIEIEPAFEDQREIIVRKVRITEPKLNFVELG